MVPAGQLERCPSQWQSLQGAERDFLLLPTEMDATNGRAYTSSLFPCSQTPLPAGRGGWQARFRQTFFYDVFGVV